MEKTETPIASRFSLYGGDLDQLAAFVAGARAYADEQGEQFMGTSWDVDELGFITVYAAGMEPLKL